MTIAPSEPPASPTTTLDSVATGLQADAYDGLSADEARRRLEDGRNELPAAASPPWWQRVLRQLREPMSLLLIAAALVSAESSQLLAGRRMAMLIGRGLLLASGAIGALAVSRAVGGTWEEARTVMFGCQPIATSSTGDS